MTSQLKNTNKNLEKVAKENNEYKTKITELKKTNSKLETKSKRLKEEVERDASETY